MQLKNEVKRVRLTAVDPLGKSKSKTMTLYDATPAEAIELTRQAALDRMRNRRPSKTASA